MSDDERGSGISGGGVVLGVGAGAGAAYVGDRMLAQEGVKEAWKGSERAPSGIVDKVKGLLGKNAALKKQADGINHFNSINDPAAPLQLTEKELKGKGPDSDKFKAAKKEFKTAKEELNTAKDAYKADKTNDALKQAKKDAAKKFEKAEKSYNALKEPVGKAAVTDAKYTSTSKGGTFQFGAQDATGKANGRHSIQLKGAAPTGVQSGKLVTEGEALTKTWKDLKSGVSVAEKELTRDIHKGIDLKMGEGLKFGSNIGRAKVGAAVLGTVAVGYAVGNAMFPSHANRIRREREEQRDMGRA